MAVVYIQETKNAVAYAVGSSSAQNTSLVLARNSSTAASFNSYTSLTNISNAIFVQQTFSKGNYNTIIYRTFFYFDLSSISGTITGLSFRVYTIDNNTGLDGSTIVMKTNAFGNNGSNFVSGDFDSWDPATPGGQTEYCGQTSMSSSTPILKTITLNSTAISDANTNGYLNVAFINWAGDRQNGQPIPFNLTTASNGIRFKSTTTNQKNELQVTYTPAPTGYGNDVNGVTSSAIARVNNVLTADIKLINNV